MLFNRKQEDKTSKFVRDRIHQARTEAGDTQEDLAKALGKTRVSVSDIERGRVSVSATDLARFAHFYSLPISFFYPSEFSVSKEKLTRLEQEVIVLFASLMDDQKYIAIEYVKKLVEISKKGLDRMYRESIFEPDENEE